MPFILKAGDRSIIDLQKSNEKWKIEAFDGVSLIEWTSDDKILFLKSSAATSIIMILINMGISLNSEMKKQPVLTVSLTEVSCYCQPITFFVSDDFGGAL